MIMMIMMNKIFNCFVFKASRYLEASEQPLVFLWLNFSTGAVIDSHFIIDFNNDQIITVQGKSPSPNLDILNFYNKLKD